VGNSCGDSKDRLGLVYPDDEVDGVSHTGDPA
jgi:hypothetical protein